MPSQLFARKPISLIHEEMKGEHRLRRVLGPVQLTALGVGCAIGVGIFVLTGKVASATTGPAIILSFVVAGLACIFAGLCYAEFASMAPVAGSAYTYAYATLGELLAWIIGWDLILEYAVGAASVANGWSSYFQNLIGMAGLKVPHLFARAPVDYHLQTGELVANHALVDLPAVLLTAVVTLLLVKGIRESAAANAFMVALKVSVVLLVIAVGAFSVDPRNWQPFAPYGYTGVSFFGRTILGHASQGGLPVGMLAGAAIIFFAYIGFDSVSTHAEEARPPQRDVPIGIIASLLVCTVLYIGVSAVLTGMVPYQQINIDAPVAAAFEARGIAWAQFVISLAAVAGLTSVVLVLMLSQPRIWLAMARDGLVPPGFFGAVHPKFRTPWKATILTGLFVAVLSGFLPLSILAELVSIGTLFAFVIVCTAVLVMRRTDPDTPRAFRAPFVPVVPILGILFCLLLMFSLPAENWLRLGVWLLLGLVVYFSYGRKRSVMARLSQAAVESEPAKVEGGDVFRLRPAKADDIPAGRLALVLSKEARTFPGPRASNRHGRDEEGEMNKMTLFSIHSLVGFGLGAMTLLLCLASPARGAITERVSVNSDEEQANDKCTYSGSLPVSQEGRCVLFESIATNLVAGDTNGAGDVFVRDRLLGITERANLASSGEQITSVSLAVAMSSDGRYALFESGPLGAHNLYLRDREAGTTEMVSLSSTGEPDDASPSAGAISDDARYVIFHSFSPLVLEDKNDQYDVFMRDRELRTTERVSLSEEGIEVHGVSVAEAISPDGRYVSFSSEASDLVAGDANGAWDVFVFDRLALTLERVSVGVGGEEGNDHSYRSSISADGRYVAFHSWATNLVPGDTSGFWDVFVRDRVAGTTERVSVSTGGVEADQDATPTGISADGRYVVFHSEAWYLAPGDTNHENDVFVRDRRLHTTERVSVSGEGAEGDSPSHSAGISARGRYVAFQSHATNLVPGDTNNRADAFLRDRCNGAPTANFVASATSLPATWPVTFTDLSLDFPSTWTWDFGDGGSATEEDPIHAYAAPGVYTVSLTVENEYGSDTETKAGCVTVSDPVVVADFTATPERGVVPLEVAFTDTSLGAPTSWLWEFGDGATATQQHPSHLYARAGNYTVTLTASVTYGTDTQARPYGVRATFSDVPYWPRHWAYHYIMACASAGIVGGYYDGTYRPSLPVARDAMAVFVSRALAGGDELVPTGPATATFSDVATDHWAFKYVEYAVDNGVVAGYPDGTYRPSLTVTRDQMAVFVSRAMVGGDEYVPTGPVTAAFTDVLTDHWAFKYIEYLRGESVVGGYPDGTYRPEVAVTRDQMAVYIQRAFALPM